MVTDLPPPVVAAIVAAQTAAAVISLTFAWRYAHVRWERTPEGRNIMAFSVCVAVVATVSIAAELWPAAWLDLALAATWATTAALMAWREHLRSNATPKPRKDADA